MFLFIKLKCMADKSNSKIMCIFKVCTYKGDGFPAHLAPRATAKPILSLFKRVIESSGIQRAKVQAIRTEWVILSKAFPRRS